MRTLLRFAVLFALGTCAVEAQITQCNGTNEELKCGYFPCDNFCSLLYESCPRFNNPCVSRCYCKQEFARDQNLVCVPIPECPPKPICKNDETFERCPDYEIRCADYFEGNSNNNSEMCEPRCQCVPGYMRRDDGICVLPLGCCMDPNAEVVPCRRNYPAPTCAERTAVSFERNCSVFPRGCQCKNGYVRFSENDPRCVQVDQCPEIPIPTTTPPRPATTPPQPTTTPPRPSTTPPQPTTIPPRPTTTPPQPTTAPPRPTTTPPMPTKTPSRPTTTPPQSTTTPRRPTTTPPRSTSTTPRSTTIQTARCNGTNEEFKCGSPCDNFCSALNAPCPIVNKPCISRCYCKPGFARDQNLVCVPIAQCSPQPICKRHEIFKTCPGHELCCAEFFQGDYNFKEREICVPSCRCRKGYLRRDDGKCVISAKCCMDPKAEVVPCRRNCPAGTCAKRNTVLCERNCNVFPKGCRCKKGYVRISENNPRCVHVGQCPKRRRNYPKKECHDEHL